MKTGKVPFQKPFQTVKSVLSGRKKGMDCWQTLQNFYILLYIFYDLYIFYFAKLTHNNLAKSESLLKARHIEKNSA